MLSVAFFHWGCMFVGLSRVWEQVYLEGGRARINHFVLPLVGLHKPVFFFQLVFFFFFPSSSCSFLLWFLVLWSEMPITFMFFQSSHHSYSSWLKTVISPEHSYLVPIGIFLSVDHQCICLSFSIVSIGTSCSRHQGFCHCGKDHTFREYPIMWQGASEMLYKSCVFFLTCYATHFFFLENVVMWFSQYMLPYMQWRALLVTCYGHADCLHCHL